MRVRANEAITSEIFSKPYSSGVSHRTALLSGQNVIFNELVRYSSVSTDSDWLSGATRTTWPEEAKIVSASSWSSSFRDCQLSSDEDHASVMPPSAPSATSPIAHVEPLRFFGEPQLRICALFA